MDGVLRLLPKWLGYRVEVTRQAHLLAMEGYAT